MKKETKSTLFAGLAMSAISGVFNPIIEAGAKAIVDKLTHTIAINDYAYALEAGLGHFFKDIEDVFYLNNNNEPDFRKNISYYNMTPTPQKQMILWGGYPITFSTGVNKEGDGSTTRCGMSLSTINTPGAINNLKRFMKVCHKMQHEREIKNVRDEVSVYGTGRRLELVRFYLKPFTKRTFQNTFIPSDQEALIKESLDKFVSKREWYKENHIPYHFGFLLYGKGGTGKAEPLTNKIPTPTKEGYTLMGDLKVGDYVFDVNGIKTKITGVFDQGVRNIYTVRFNDGRSIDVSDEHLFGVYTMSHGREKYSVKSVADMLKDYKRLLKTPRHNEDPYAYRYKIPRPMFVNYPSKEVPVHPWVLGCFIGNGCCREKYLTISSENDEIPRMIAGIYNFTYKRNSDACYSYVFYDNKSKLVKTEDFFKDIPEMINCYSRDKKIPDEYIINDVNTRLMVIQGLMDTDGSITINQNRFNIRYTSTSKVLLNQMKHILYSFGFSSTISEDCRGEEKYIRGFCGNLIINISNKEKYKLFSLARKRTVAHMAWKFGRHYATKYDNLIIKDISFSRREECRCIMVESPMHLYLTENFIVTHNTTLAQAIADYIHAELIVFPGDAISELPKYIGTDICRDTVDSSIYRVVCIEDVDCGFAQARMTSVWDDEEEKEVKRKVGLAEILNCIDGLQAPQNTIYVFTTNHMEKLDPALIRPGRCDVKLEIPGVTYDTFKKFAVYHYGEGADTFIDDHFIKDFTVDSEITFAELQTDVMKGVTLADVAMKIMKPTTPYPRTGGFKS